MTTFDFSPLFRTSVGYDRLASLLNSASRLEQGRRTRISFYKRTCFGRHDAELSASLCRIIRGVWP